MVEKKVNIGDEDGRISISEEVIAAIARIAAGKVDGIAHPSSSASGGLKSFFGGEDLSPAIKTELTEDGVHIELRIAVEYGYPVHEVAQGIQGNVQQDIEKLAGVTVTGVDVFVKKVVPPQTLESGIEEE
ncbi:MAG: Asp23/Gls24 family envelope stress response protein [Candidatus Bipolaricaulota bacterium]|nr:Asp23/Gls24 family envelope stress response protein [Candidatus Bipolaricaulota bacterium]